MLSKQQQTSSNRIKPKAKIKKSGIKDDTKAVRFNPTEYKERQDFILSKEVCQVCEVSYDLDTPHHVLQGIGFKDDRSLINICKMCHWSIHSGGGYAVLKKTKHECLLIAFKNDDEFLSYKGGN